MKYNIKNNKMKKCNKNILKSKKALSSQGVIIGIVITIISFYLILGFFISNKNIVSSYSEDLLCRATIEAKATATVNSGIEISKRVGVDSFFNVLNNKCQVDYINIKSVKRDEIFKTIADEQARCYFRYGEGEKDFLNSFETSGSWCFVCGVVNVEEKTHGEYTYDEYIKWLSQTEYKKENGKSIKYSDYMKVKYTNVKDDELSKIKVQLSEVLSEGDPALNGVANIVLIQYNALQDLKLKKIDSSEPIYVVYRYNRIDKTFEQKMTDATKGATYLMIGAIVVGAGVETVLTGPSGLKSIITIPANIVKSTAKIARLGEISSKMKNLIKTTGKAEKISDVSKFFSAGKTGLKFKSFENFNMNVKEMNVLVKTLEDSGEIEKASKVKMIVSKMDELGVQSFDDIAKADKLSSEKLEILKNKFSDKSWRFETDNALDLYMKEKRAIDAEVGDYKALGDIIEQEIKAGTFDAKVHGPMISDYMRVAYFGSIGATGAYIGANINSKSEQYVDIMTKEQYFRLCGTERRIDGRIKAQK